MQLLSGHNCHVSDWRCLCVLLAAGPQLGQLQTKQVSKANPLHTSCTHGYEIASSSICTSSLNEMLYSSYRVVSASTAG
jgi:hypothetical protein